MSKGGRKGRVSNELVAASCAAIPAVYAAGYWRTRHEARRLETQAKPSKVAAEMAPPPEPAVAAAAPEPPPPVETWHDGTYTGWRLSRHGDIETRVTIKNGGIVAAGIATCATRYPCSVIDGILEQPIYRQSPGVDRVSRATSATSP